MAGLVIAFYNGLPAQGEAVTIPLPSPNPTASAGVTVPDELQVEVLEVRNHVPGSLRVQLVRASVVDGGVTDRG
jgi:hypothetical protein